MLALPVQVTEEKNSVTYCLRLLVPVVAICETEENRMWEQRWGEVSPSGLRAQGHCPKINLLGWAPQLGAQVEVGLEPRWWEVRKEPSRG